MGDLEPVGPKGWQLFIATVVTVALCLAAAAWLTVDAWLGVP